MHIGDDIIGESQTERHGVDYDLQTAILHPKYNTSSVAAYYDVAIIITETVTFTDFIQPGCVPQNFENSIDIYKDRTAELIGEYPC